MYELMPNVPVINPLFKDIYMGQCGRQIDNELNNPHDQTYNAKQGSHDV